MHSDFLQRQNLPLIVPRRSSGHSSLFFHTTGPRRRSPGPTRPSAPPGRPRSRPRAAPAPAPRRSGPRRTTRGRTTRLDPRRDPGTRSRRPTGPRAPAARRHGSRDRRRRSAGGLCLVPRRLAGQLLDHHHVLHAGVGGRDHLVDDRGRQAGLALDDLDGRVHGLDAVGHDLLDDLLVALVLRADVDAPPRQARGQAGVLALLADGEGELLVVHDDRRDALFLVESHLTDPRRAAGPPG